MSLCIQSRFVRDSFILIALLLVAGCGMRDEIVDEMDSAYKSVQNEKGGDSKEKSKAITSLVVRKFFPIGITHDAVKKELAILHDRGFEVLELKHEGTRVWPSGNFISYVNVNREKKYPQGSTGYIAEKEYDAIRLINTKTAVISIKVNSNGSLIESEGWININGI